MKNSFVVLVVVVLLLAAAAPVSAAAPSAVGVNVLLNRPISEAILADLHQYGTVLDLLPQINALTLRITSGDLTAIRALPYVAAAEADAVVSVDLPREAVELSSFADGISTWDLDMINVTDYGVGRTIGYDGSGVYVAILDTGLARIWRVYFPPERIAEPYGICFGGGGGDQGWVSTQPEKWQHDIVSHGTHVASTILGYNHSWSGTAVNGVAPMATVIPVKVLNQNGSGWSSVVARGILYVADLKAGPLSGHPMVINMSLGGSADSALLRAAIDYAISRGVLIVVAAGNEGAAGMHYPGAYAPVISVAASGWTKEWTDGPVSLTATWWQRDVPDPTNPDDAYIGGFSSRELPGQDLDVAAPGTAVVGPTSLQQGFPRYGFWQGTSMAAPHVAGIVALMAQKYPALTQAQAESILESSAIPLPPGCRTVLDYGTLRTICWGADATGAGLASADAALAATP